MLQVYLLNAILLFLHKLLHNWIVFTVMLELMVKGGDNKQINSNIMDIK